MGQPPLRRRYTGSGAVFLVRAAAAFPPPALRGALLTATGARAAAWRWCRRLVATTRARDSRPVDAGAARRSPPVDAAPQVSPGRGGLRELQTPPAPELRELRNRAAARSCCLATTGPSSARPWRARAARRSPCCTRRATAPPPRLLRGATRAPAARARACRAAQRGDCTLPSRRLFFGLPSRRILFARGVARTRFWTSCRREA